MRTKTTYRVAKQYQNHPFNLQPNQLRQINLVAIYTKKIIAQIIFFIDI